MAQITIYRLPKEAYSYLRTILPETRNVYYTKYIVNKIGLFSLIKGRAIEWTLTNPVGGLTLYDLLRQGQNLIASTINVPTGGLIRFNLRARAAKIFTPNPNVISLWSYSIQSDQNKRIWSSATARYSPFAPNARPQDNPALARCTLQRNNGVAEYWALPRELSYPSHLKMDKRGRLWFSLNLVSGAGNHQFAVFDPAANVVTGFTIRGIGTAGIGDIAVDTAKTTVWLTYRSPDAVYRYDWNTKEAIEYVNHSVVGPSLNAMSAKDVPVFISRDGHLNTVDPDRKTGVRKVIMTKYQLTPEVTELSSHDLGVSRSMESVPSSVITEPETYAGPFIRWPVPAYTGSATPVDVKTVGNWVYFAETGDELLCRMRM